LHDCDPSPLRQSATATLQIRQAHNLAALGLYSCRCYQIARGTSN
jgi:hypothetical protein